MKKVFMVLAVVASLFVGVKSASAMTEEKLKEVFEQKFEVKGKTYTIADDAKIMLERYLKQYDVSESDCDYIADRVNDAIKIVQNAGVTEASQLTKETKDELKKLVEKVSANTSVKATVKKKSVVVLKPDGSVFVEIDKPIKQTGSETNVIAIVAGVSFLVTVAGALLVVRQVKHN